MDVLASVGWPVVDRIHVFDLPISPHGIGIAIGYLLGAMIMMREAPKHGLDERNVSTILFWALIGALVGARAFYVAAHFSDYSGHLVDVFKVYQGGISLLGGIAGAIIFAYPLFRRYRYGFLQVMDPAAYGLAAGLIIGRIGDLIIGDHLGKPTSWALGFRYSGGNLSGFDCVADTCQQQLVGGQQLLIDRQGALLTDAGQILARGVGVHQTALYDFMSSILLFAFLWFVVRRFAWRRGVLIASWAVWYLGMRVFTDNLRVDKRFFGLTGSQWASITVGSIALGALIYWAVERRRGRSPPLSTVYVPPREPSAHL